MRLVILVGFLLMGLVRVASADPITWRFDGHFDGQSARDEYSANVTDQVTLWLAFTNGDTFDHMLGNIGSYHGITYVLDLGGFVFTNYPNESQTTYMYGRDNLPSSGLGDSINPEIENQRQNSLGTRWDGLALHYIYFNASLPSDAIQDFRLTSVLDHDLNSSVTMYFAPRTGPAIHAYTSARFTHVAAVPEPSALALSVLGLVTAWSLRRRIRAA
jgi:hypothetical protein